MPQGQVLAPWQGSIEGASALLHRALPTSCLISPSCSYTDLLESPAPTAYFSRSHSAHAALCLGFSSFFLWSICPNHKMKLRCCLFQEVFLAPPSCLLPLTLPPAFVPRLMGCSCVFSLKDVSCGYLSLAITSVPFCLGCWDTQGPILGLMEHVCSPISPPSGCISVPQPHLLLPHISSSLKKDGSFLKKERSFYPSVEHTRIAGNHPQILLWEKRQSTEISKQK